MKAESFIKIINFVLASGLAVLLIWLVMTDINPSGIREIKYSAGRPNKLVEGPQPTDRIIGRFGQGDDSYWEVAVDPIYFNLYIPRLYQQITMEVVYQSERQDILELGGLGSSRGWEITLKPGENKILDNLTWPCLTFEGVIFCQNPSRLGEKLLFSTPAEFVNQARYSKILTYHYKFHEQNKIDEVVLSSGIRLDDYDYLAATYNTPVNLPGGWRRVSATFSASELWLAEHIYKFMISAPKLDKHNGRLRIKEVDFILQKEPINKDNLALKWQRFWRRNLSKFGL